MTRRGFSLLETLIATGVLIMVVLAVTSLSNSLIVGTVSNADKAIINRWNAEGLELVQKIRNDNLLDLSTANNPSINWFAPAVGDNGSTYGWHTLTQGTTSNTWVLARVAGNTINLTSDSFKLLAGSGLKSDQTVGYRLICIEGVGASDSRDGDNFFCNTENHQLVADGSRNITGLSDCAVGDKYCEMTQTSLNTNALNPSKFIPPGNAVKIRSVTIWDDRGEVKMGSLATLLTNWKGYEQ